MPYYQVHVYFNGYGSHVIEAENEEAARNQAQELPAPEIFRVEGYGVAECVEITVAQATQETLNKFITSAPKQDETLAPFLNGYLRAILFTETDESDKFGGLPLDSTFTIEDFAPEALDLARRDCSGFLNRQLLGGPVSAWLEKEGKDPEQAGIDFWLTRNGHGTGFWDRLEVYGTYVANELDHFAKSYGPAYATVDAGQIYLEQ